MKEKLKRLLKKIPIPITKNHGYDMMTRSIIKKYLCKDSNTIDVGCHKGEVLEFMHKNAPGGMHWGLEPIPYLYKSLVRKFERIPNCTILNYAISDKIGKVEFNHVISNPSYSGLIKRDYDKTNETDEIIKVHTNTLDQIIPENLPIAMIKIDVEGGEYQVLRGAKRIIKTFKPIVIFEHGLGSSEYYGSFPDKVFEFFASSEMKISTLSSFLKKDKSLSLVSLEKCYYDKTDYYFVAHPQIN